METKELGRILELGKDFQREARELGRIIELGRIFTRKLGT